MIFTSITRMTNSPPPKIGCNVGGCNPTTSENITGEGISLEEKLLEERHVPKLNF